MKRIASFALAVIVLAACGKDSGPTAPKETGQRIVTRAYNEVSTGSGTVRTDKDDYVPGETVTVLGGGWEPGETVVMTITEEPEVQDDLLLSSVADAEGAFVNADFAVTDIHAGVVFTLTAVGQSSGMTASTMFNDGTIGAVTFSFHQGTTSGSPPNTCTGPSLGATPSVTSGTEICVVASFPITGSGATQVQVRWRNPSNTITQIDSRADNFPNEAMSGAFSASTTPTATGTWTALVCQSMNDGGSMTGCQPAGAQRGSANFTVNAAPADNDAPVVSCTVPDASIWYGTDVIVNCTASDASGLQNAADAAISLSTSVPAGTETTNASTGTRQVCDIHGNCATAGPYIFKVDKKAPEISCGSPDGAWHASDVAIACTATDGGSGLADPGDAGFDLSTSVPAGTETDNASTDSRNVADLVGNSATAGPIAGNKVDKKAPEISCGSPDGAWHATDVSIACTAMDGGSGLAVPADASFDLSTSVAAGTETNNASTGSRNVADMVGNSATAGPIGGNLIDKKGPVVTLSCPAAPVILNSTANASWTAVDGGSGVVPPNDAGNIGLDTSSVGPKTATAVAGTSQDGVGNQSGQTTCGYNVAYLFSGFFQPVDNPPIMNLTKAIQAVPLKWLLQDALGQPVTNLTIANVKVGTLACGGGLGSDVVEEYAAGNSGLQNLGNGYYQFNWKTLAAYAKTCRILYLDLGEGPAVSHTAYFQFK